MHIFYGETWVWKQGGSIPMTPINPCLGGGEHTKIMVYFLNA